MNNASNSQEFRRHCSKPEEGKGNGKVKQRKIPACTGRDEERAAQKLHNFFPYNFHGWSSFVEYQLSPCWPGLTGSNCLVGTCRCFLNTLGSIRPSLHFRTLNQHSPSYVGILVLTFLRFCENYRKPWLDQALIHQLFPLLRSGESHRQLHAHFHYSTS